MRKFYISCLMLVLMGCMLFSGNVQAQTNFNKRFAKELISTPESRQRADWGLLGYSQNLRKQQAANVEAFDTVQADGFYFLEGPDGSDWIYTEEYTWGKQFNQIASATYTFYDATHKEVGKVTIDVDTARYVNDMYPYGIVTNKFFDSKESTYEITIYEHEVIAEGVTTEKVYVYNTKGERVCEFDGGQVAIFNIQRTSYETYSRMLMVSHTVNADSVYGYKVDFYKPVGWGTENQLEHSLFVPEANTHALVGMYFNTYNIDGHAYYAISQYEKPFFSGPVDMTNGSQPETPNNNFMVTLLDEKYDTVSVLKVPCEKPQDLCRMYGCGFLTYDDVSKGFYSGDDDFNFLVTIDDFQMMKDQDKFAFHVYNSKSEKIKTLDEDVDAEGLLKLNNIKGFEQQFAFGHTEVGADGVASSFIRLVDIPSCTVAQTITPTTDLPLSFSLNRYPKGNDYQYVVEYSEPEVDADGNLLVIVGWFNSDLTFDRSVKFNIGTSGLRAMFNLTPATLNPFFFDTDKEHEYVYLLNAERENSDKKDTYLKIADHTGKEIASYIGTEATGAIIQVGFMNVTKADKTMYIAYRHDDTDRITLEFYSLPLECKLKGAGTEADPYLIASQGDLEQISKDPTAHYKQVCDIDMSLTDIPWQAIPTFRGVYDGGNFKIKNLYVEDASASYLALFGEVTEATIKNVVLTHPIVRVGTYNAYVGTLASYAIKSFIENVHVYDAEIVAISESASPEVGGIVANTSFEGHVWACSFNDGVINIPNGYSVGGIAGKTGTATPIESCFVSGEITAKENVGGVMGDQGDAVNALNNHVKANIKGLNTIGGIAGWNSSRALIVNNIVEGSIASTDSCKWGGYVGGLVGNLGEYWGMQGPKRIYNNVVLLSSLSTATPKDSTIHGMVGHSIENTEAEAGKDPYVEVGLENNYINLKEWAGTHDNLGGQLVSADTLNQAFFKKLGFVYGDSVKGPWVDSKLPHLYIEDYDATIAVEALRLNYTTLEIALNDSARLKAYIEPFDATEQDIVWSIADAEIATLEEGLLTALKVGTTTVTATTADGKFKATCAVTVVDKTGLEDVLTNEAARAHKVLVNGTLYIIRNNEWYTIDGLRVK